ncbi:MAG TPA: hypothetical protein VH370_04065 [Humisphaera sp.]|nr:hypothetical protein [Humisphaera sp.]
MSAITSPSVIALSKESAVAERPRAIEHADATTAAPAAPAKQRLVSLDAYRGFVMVLMVSAGLGIPRVYSALAKEGHLSERSARVWKFLAYETDHTAWVGCSLWDIIQPSFMFMVGAAMAFSLASRRAKGQSFLRMLIHAIVRSAVLIGLAVLFSTESRQDHTNWIFTNVLAQIGLGYTFLFLLACVPPSRQIAAVIGILVLHWSMFAIFPTPPANLDTAVVGVPSSWQKMHGFSAHWEKNTSFAHNFDRWFLNLFPRGKDKLFAFNVGGYTTLNFVPSLATMLLGLLTGELLRSRRGSWFKLGVMLAAGVAGLAIGWTLNELGVCPLVKRIWTPSWVIFSAGWALVLLGLFYFVMDIAKVRLWAMPLVVVGANSIAVYTMSQMLHPWFRDTARRHFGGNLFNMFGATWSPMVDTGLFLIFCWLACWWMYRSKIFVKI